MKKIKSKLHVTIWVKIFNQIKKFRIRKKLFPFIENVLASLSIISILIDIRELNENFFLDYELPSGRGNDYILNIKKKRIKIIDESYNFQ